MNNDKTKSRQRKGREPSEKTVFIRRYVSHRLLAAKLWNPLVICRLATSVILRNFRDSVNCWLANSQNSKMEGVK